MVEGDADLPEVVSAIQRMLGYRVLKLDEHEAVLERGNKLLTYIGLTGHPYVYRRLRIRLLNHQEGRSVFLFEYRFSWLTNIGYLPRFVFNELRTIVNEINVRTLRRVSNI
ncbi:MAG: hypothetical protein ABWK00_05725 [Desulfurococcaceae archaeon]